MYNAQTNYPNYMPVLPTISPQLFFINTAQDLNLLPAPTGINFYYCQQENKIYSRLNQNGQIKLGKKLFLTLALRHWKKRLCLMMFTI